MKTDHELERFMRTRRREGVAGAVVGRDCQRRRKEKVEKEEEEGEVNGGEGAAPQSEREERDQCARARLDLT